jgi:hypothetical protein
MDESSCQQLLQYDSCSLEFRITQEIGGASRFGEADVRRYTKDQTADFRDRTIAVLLQKQIGLISGLDDYDSCSRCANSFFSNISTKNRSVVLVSLALEKAKMSDLERPSLGEFEWLLANFKYDDFSAVFDPAPPPLEIVVSPAAMVSGMGTARKNH